jgi:integrase
VKVHFTQTYVNSLKPSDKPYWVSDEGCQNLRLYVGSSGKVWYTLYRDSGGKKQSRKIGPASSLTVTEARNAAKKITGRALSGENLKKESPTPKISYGDFLINHYEPWVLAQRRTGKETLQIIRSSFDFLMQRSLENISILEIEQWRTKCVNKGLKAASVNRMVCALKASVNWAVQHEIIKENPIARLTPLKEHDSDKKIRYLSPEERQRLYAALEARENRIKMGRGNHNKWLDIRERPTMPDLKNKTFVDHLKPAVIVSLNTGIRQGSLFQLKWSDIDFRESVLTIRPDAEKTGKIVHIPMNDYVIETLEAWRKETGGRDSDLVFPSPRTGKIMDNCNRAWRKLLKGAGIENFRWHDMRHDFASQLVMKGVDLNTVRELMGHADMKMTLRYAHLAPKVRKAAVALLVENQTNGSIRSSA